MVPSRRRAWPPWAAFGALEYAIKRMPDFDRWITHIKDRITQQRLNLRLRKASLGNLGDVRSVGNGVYEMREHFGPG